MMQGNSAVFYNSEVVAICWRHPIPIGRIYRLNDDTEFLITNETNEIPDTNFYIQDMKTQTFYY